MTNSKKNTPKISLNTLYFIIKSFILVFNIFIEVLKTGFALFVIPFLRYLIPQNIRNAISRFLPLVIRPYIAPLFLLIINALRKYFTANSKVLHLRKIIANLEEIKPELNTSNTNSENLVFLKILLKNSEDELYHVKGESIAAITCASVILAVTAPVSILPVAAATTIGTTLGNFAYETMTFVYCRAKGIPNTYALGKTINQNQDFTWQNYDKENTDNLEHPILKLF